VLRSYEEGVNRRELGERGDDIMTKQKARIIGLVYLLFFLTSILSVAFLKGLIVKNDSAATANAIVAHERLFHLGVATGLIQTGFYIALTALFYVLFKPASRSVSLVAAFFGLVGCAIQASGSVFQFFALANLRNGGTVSIFSSDELSGRAVGMLFLKLNDQTGSVALVLFGVYCLLIGCLILRSIFLPRFLGVLMVLAGLGWLIFLYPPLAERLFGYIAIIGITAEALLMLWMLVMGVNTEHWQEQAAAQKT
jgi:hypothetical protein